MFNFLCFIFGHKLKVRKHISGNIRHGVRLLLCSRCQHRFIMSDAHMAFIRYDNDGEFTEDMLIMYKGKLSINDI